MNAEQMIWEYIDGSCDDPTKEQVQQKLNTDVQWQNLYGELLLLHKSISADMEAELPSMRFTKNVMEKIATEAIVNQSKSYFNPIIIRSVSFVLIASIIFLLAYAFSTVNWNETTAMKYYNSSTLHAFLWVNIILGLVLIDRIVNHNKKRPIKHLDE